MKRNKLLLIICTLIVALFAFSGCMVNPTGSSESSLQSSEEKKEMLLSAERLDLIVGDEVRLTAYNYELKAGETLQYTSSAPSIVQVDESGNIVAKGCGEAVITVTYAGAL